MPVLRTIKTYRHRGRKRFIRLYRAWWNMRNRVAGRIRAGNGTDAWAHVNIVPEWLDFETFRSWALANGYSRTRCSLDRERTADDYGPANCRWMTVRQNSHRALHPDPLDMGGKPVFSANGEPPF